MTPRPLRTGVFIWLAIALCPLSGAFGGWLGGVAAILFQMHWGISSPLRFGAMGPLLGLVGGLLAGGAWCAVMIPLAMRGLRRKGSASPRIIAWGALAGHAAGLLAAGVLIGGLMYCNGQWSRPAVLTGLAASAALGLPLGALAGVLAWAAAAIASVNREEQQEAERPS